MRTPVLNRKLVLEAATQVPDGAGGFTEVWNALGTLWAEVTAGTGREVNAGGLAVSSVPCKIMVRSAPVDAPSRPMAGQRFVDSTRIFRILAVAEADKGARYLTCVAREEVVA